MFAARVLVPLALFGLLSSSLAARRQAPARGVQPLAGAAAAIPVKFVAPPLDGPVGSTQAAEAALCLLDVDGDSAIDYLRADRSGAVVMRNDGKGKFSQGRALVATWAVRCAAGDYDNDEKPDLAIATESGVSLYRNTGGAFDATAAPVVLKNGPGTRIAALSFVDFDHDADLDLVIARAPAGEGLPAAAAVVLRNNGNGTFDDVTTERGLGIANAGAVTASDLDNDRAIDLVFTGEKVTVALNPREGVYKMLDAFAPYGPASTRGVVAFDFDKDGWMDLAFTHFEGPVSLWRSVEGKRFERVQLPEGLFSGFGLTAIDYDNDGWVDLVAGGYGRQGGGALQALHNVDGRFVDASEAVGAGNLAAGVPYAIAVGDTDGDNDSDLLLTIAGQAPAVFRNDGGNANNAVRIALLGLTDNRSGVGTTIEVRAGTMWQKFQTVAASGFAAQGSPDILAGIGKAAQVDVVRLLWPTGVVQDEVALKANARHAITQIDRR